MLVSVIALLGSFLALTWATDELRANRVKRIVGGSPAELPAYDDPVVYLRFASRSAQVRGVRDLPHYVFRGIRYAKAPTKNDRFQRPNQFFLQGDIDATKYPPPCIQPVPGENRIVGSEDCLFLNVFTPDLPSGTEGLPVVVWIHGGGFRYGSASQYGVRQLVGKRLIVVTIQYRLGSLGFLGTGTPEFPGNAALWDMVMAVQWVRNHIGFFGGNPYQIVVMGHGTGASSSLLMALNNVSKGLTKGVIALSGTAVSHWAVDDNPVGTAQQIAEIQGCPTTSVVAMVKCLQSVSADNIIQGDSAVEFERLNNQGFVSGMQGRLGPIPTTEGNPDGRSLPPLVEDNPMSESYYTKAPKISILTGVTKDETKRAVNGQYKKEILNKLQSIPHFLDEHIVQSLQEFTGLGRGGSGGGNSLFSLVDPLNFRKYVTVTKNNLAEGLDKIAEMTNDALFNLPAFLTAEMWTKHGNNAYLYSFEHAVKKKRVHHLLSGVPLIGNHSADDKSDAPSHGDDLFYIFEPQTLDGAPMPSIEAEFTGEDKRVRDIYTDMIASFVRTGKVMINDKTVPAFTTNSNNLIQISEKPKISSQFRFCQMGLWAGLSQRLQSTACNFLNVLGTEIHNTEVLLFDTINSTKTGLTNILGGNGKPQPEVKNTHGGASKISDTLRNPIGVLGQNLNAKNKMKTTMSSSKDGGVLGFLKI